MSGHAFPIYVTNEIEEPWSYEVCRIEYRTATV